MIPEESRNLYEYLTKVRHDKYPSRVYMPEHIVAMLIDYAQAARLSLLNPQQLVMFGTIVPLHYEHQIAWVWLCENLQTYIEGLERGIITYSPN